MEINPGNTHHHFDAFACGKLDYSEAGEAKRLGRLLADALPLDLIHALAYATDSQLQHWFCAHARTPEDDKKFEHAFMAFHVLNQASWIKETGNPA